MSLDPKFVRWVRASTEKFFDDAQDTYMMYFEEDPNRFTSLESSYYEFRMDGPDISELSHGVYQVYTEVNILVSSVITEDLHEIDDMIGTIVARMLSGPIHLYKYGVATNPANDGSFIGCLPLMQKARHDLLEVNRFGRIHRDVAMKQATVEGHYKETFSL
jgi:hypothetical protein